MLKNFLNNKKVPIPSLFNENEFVTNFKIIFKKILKYLLSNNSNLPFKLYSFAVKSLLIVEFPGNYVFVHSHDMISMQMSKVC